MSSKAELDDAIVSAVKSGKSVSWAIVDYLFDRGWRPDVLVSQRLRALKKAGRLTYSKTRGWRVPAQEKQT